MSINDIPIFIVNLKKDTQKKEHIQRLCAEYDLYPEFIEAVYGRELSQNDVEAIYSENKAIEDIGWKLSRGEIGCALSHKNIYKKMIDENIGTALILEDDIDFDENLLTLLDQKESFTNKWELVLLGHHRGSSRKIDTASSFWGRKGLINGYKLARPCEHGYGTYGYLITNNGAKKLLKQLSIISKPIDVYTGNSKYINLYIVCPAPIKIHEYMSDNFNSMKERVKLQKMHITSIETRKESLQKKITELLGLYQLLVDIRDNIKMFIKKIKPLRKYE